jgi:hypothetical protein
MGFMGLTVDNIIFNDNFVLDIYRSIKSSQASGPEMFCQLISGGDRSPPPILVDLAALMSIQLQQNLRYRLHKKVQVLAK